MARNITAAPATTRRTRGGKLIPVSNGVGTSRRAVPAESTPAPAAKAAVKPAAKATPVKPAPAKAAPARKPTPVKATPAKATPAKATPVKGGPVSKAAAAAKAAKTAPAKTAPAPKAKAERAPFTVPAGYTVRWPHASYDLLKKDDKAAEGAAWLVVCNAHGTTTEALNASAGDKLGSAAGRPEWCPSCAKQA